MAKGSYHMSIVKDGEVVDLGDGVGQIDMTVRADRSDFTRAIERLKKTAVEFEAHFNDVKSIAADDGSAYARALEHYVDPDADLDLCGECGAYWRCGCR